MVIALQALLALAYAVLAHIADTRHDDGIGAIALAVLALMVLLKPLAGGRIRAWGALGLCAAGIAFLYRIGLVALPMLLVPVAFLGLVSFWFGRTLIAGKVPLITRIVAAMDRMAPESLPPPLRDYTRNLSAAWAWLLGVLAVVNLMLAAIATPDGLIALLGWRAPWTVTREQWSLFANFCNYGIVGGFFIVEYQMRKRRFPGRYHNFADFLRQLAALGPEFWKNFLR